MQYDDPEEDVHGNSWGDGDCDCDYELIAPEKKYQEGTQKIELSVRGQGRVEERQLLLQADAEAQSQVEHQNHCRVEGKASG